MEIFDKLFDYQVEPVKRIVENSKTANTRETVFFGDSLIQGFDLKKHFPNKLYHNCGVNGATTTQLLYLHEYAIKPYDPSELVILIGTNDLSDTHQYALLDIVYTMYKLLEIVNNNYNVETIYIISPLPIEEDKKSGIVKSNGQLRMLGKEFSKLTTEFDNVKYIDVFDSFLENGNLISSMSDDGLHLNEKGYERLATLLRERVA